MEIIALIAQQIERLETRIKELERNLDREITYKDALEQAEVKIKELGEERDTLRFNFDKMVEVASDQTFAYRGEQKKVKELVEGIQGILNQKNLMSFTIQKQLEKLITRKCPKCDGELSFDEVDIGVGTMQGNYRCNACGWSDQDVSYLKGGTRERP